MSRTRSLSCIALMSGAVLLAAGSRAPLAAQAWGLQQQLLLRQQLFHQQLFHQQLFHQQLFHQQLFHQQLLQQQAMQRLLYLQMQQQARQRALAQSAPPASVAVVVPVPIDPPAPIEVAGKQKNVAGITLTGSEDLASYGALEFRFASQGKVTMIDADGKHAGRYTRMGSRLTLQFYNGTVIYTGTYDGNTLTGTASNGKKNWNFTVSR